MPTHTPRARPRILCLTSHDIDGPDSGGGIRARNIFQLLARFGDVRVVCAGHSRSATTQLGTSKSGLGPVEVLPLLPAPDRSAADHWRKLFDGRFLNTHKVQASSRDQERMRTLLAEHDLVWIHGLKAANGFGLYRWPHAVLDIDDIPSAFHRTQRGQAGLFGKLRFHERVVTWRRRETTLRERFAALCVCSAPDRQELARLDRVFVLPNGFAGSAHAPARRPATPPRIGFVGLLDYRPNREGVQWFIRHVWPQILLAHPAARLRLAGRGGEALGRPDRPNTDVLGWVADLETEMATWALSIVPVFVGGGTRIKIADALSRQCPVVSTNLGAYGYDLVDGSEIRLADSARDFAARCLELLSDPEASQAMAERGRQRFLENWTWDSYADRVAQILETVRPEWRYPRTESRIRSTNTRQTI